MPIPLSRSVLGPEEAAALQRVLDSGRLIQGPQVEAFERAVADRVGRKYGIAVSNGTSALQLALGALEIGAGASVLVPDLTWPSPGHAVLGVGATPVLVDVDIHSWNVSLDQLSQARAPQVRAAIVIDQFGCPAQVKEASAALSGLPIIVDAACSLGSHDGELPCGARGHIACLSFHPRKLVTTGEGGMCLTDDSALAERLRILRNHGQREPGCFVCAAGNARMSELAAAVGCSQLARLDAMLEDRRRLGQRYAAELQSLCPQHISAGAKPNYQTFGVILPTHTSRDEVIRGMRERGVEVGRLSYALHTLPQFSAARDAAAAAGRTLEVSARIAQQGLALPLFPGLSDAEQGHVIASLKDVLA